jgi:hypothetical protein
MQNFSYFNKDNIFIVIFINILVGIYFFSAEESRWNRLKAFKKCDPLSVIVQYINFGRNLAFCMDD